MGKWTIEPYGLPSNKRYYIVSEGKTIASVGNHTMAHDLAEQHNIEIDTQSKRIAELEADSESLNEHIIIFTAGNYSVRKLSTNLDEYFQYGLWDDKTALYLYKYVDFVKAKEKAEILARVATERYCDQCGDVIRKGWSPLVYKGWIYCSPQCWENYTG